MPRITRSTRAGRAVGDRPGPVLLDTDVFSCLLKGPRQAASWTPVVAGKHVLVSFVTVAELFAWAEIHRWGSPRRNALARAISTVTVIPPNQELIAEWASVRAESLRDGHPLGARSQTHDAWIAASARLYELPLATGNGRHFAGVAGIALIDG
ncbi:PIN domain-containing protein [Patulibacter defluvii]|uniref:PIN domain-containing protein n=1 Tax=Patulibacter defluvii TaxID=3095358 RepID=UPI002A76155D|nr:PIN domain-containing protein [Patulibacter sp. DM4]